MTKAARSVSLLRRRANARNVSFRISLRWLTYIVNSVDKTKLSCITKPGTSSLAVIQRPGSLSDNCEFVYFSANACLTWSYVLALPLRQAIVFFNPK